MKSIKQMYVCKGDFNWGIMHAQLYDLIFNNKCSRNDF